ncbi:MAG: protocatechuate 3,4-dioxygenase subunit alpha [Gammaproteobacteria bacterium]
MADDDTRHESPSQTAGPYVHIGCLPNWSGIAGVYAEDLGSRLINADTRGKRVSVAGRIFDGDDAPVPDAVIEFWQADAGGLYPSPVETRGAADPNFGGWGRVASAFDSGEFRIDTIRPGRVPYPDGRLQAPHINCWIVARGINVGLQTRIYFADEAEANAEDPVLALIEPRARVDTLLAQPDGEGGFRFDIRLQGERETVFFDI